MMSRNNIGDEGIVLRDIPTLCHCGFTIPVGSFLKIIGRTSQQAGIREVLVDVKDPNGNYVGGHKVKLSKIWLQEVVCS